MTTGAKIENLGVGMDSLRKYFQTIGGNIIRLRTGLNMSQEQFSIKAGIGKSTLQRMEKGDKCTLNNLLKIAHALDINPADLFLTRKDREEITYKTKLLIEKITEVLNLK